MLISFAITDNEAKGINYKVPVLVKISLSLFAVLLRDPPNPLTLMSLINVGLQINVGSGKNIKT